MEVHLSLTIEFGIRLKEAYTQFCKITSARLLLQQQVLPQEAHTHSKWMLEIQWVTQAIPTKFQF